MYWFKHDADASQDAKLQNVLLDYGLEGYGLYWYCLELIVGKIDADNITFELEHDARIIARNTGSTAQKVEEMMRYFVAQGLFESNQAGVVTCMKLAKRLDKSMTSNPKMRALIDKIRGKNHDDIMINPDEGMIKPDAIMQDKIRIDKNIKEKDLVDSGESPAEKVDFVSKEFDRFWRNYPTKKAKKPALSAFRSLVKNKRESQVKFYVDMILNYHLDCIARLEPGADALHAATLINQKRWEDNPEYFEAFKREWIEENRQ
jgi:hypothetical protein